MRVYRGLVEGRDSWITEAETGAEAERLASRAAILTELRHPGIVDLRAADDGGAGGRLVTAWVGPSLEASLEAFGAQLGPSEVAGIGAAVATTLADVHALGWAHGTVRADHVLLDEAGRPVLCGISGALPSAGPSDCGGDTAAIITVLEALIPEGHSGPAWHALRRALQPRRHPTDPARLAERLAAPKLAPALPSMVAADRDAGPGGSRPVGVLHKQAVVHKQAVGRRSEGARPDGAAALSQEFAAADLPARPLAPTAASGATPVAGKQPEAAGLPQSVSVISLASPSKQRTSAPKRLASARKRAVAAPRLRSVLARLDKVDAPDDAGAKEPTVPGVEGDRQPVGGRRFGTRRTVAGAVAAVVSGAMLCVGAVGLVPRSSNAVVRCPAVDLGCGPQAARGGVLTVAIGRFGLGEPGDVIVLGRWGCGPVALPAVLRPASGSVWVFDRWPAAGLDVAARPVGQVGGAVSLTVVPGTSGCDRLEVRRVAGSSEMIDPVAPR